MEIMKKIMEYFSLPIREEPYVRKSDYMNVENIYKALGVGSEHLNVRQLEIAE